MRVTGLSRGAAMAEVRNRTGNFSWDPPSGAGAMSPPTPTLARRVPREGRRERSQPPSYEKIGGKCAETREQHGGRSQLVVTQGGGTKKYQEISFPPPLPMPLWVDALDPAATVPFAAGHDGVALHLANCRYLRSPLPAAPRTFDNSTLPLPLWRPVGAPPLDPQATLPERYLWLKALTPRQLSDVAWESTRVKETGICVVGRHTCIFPHSPATDEAFANVPEFAVLAAAARARIARARGRREGRQLRGKKKVRARPVTQGPAGLRVPPNGPPLRPQRERRDHKIKERDGSKVAMPTFFYHWARMYGDRPGEEGEHVPLATLRLGTRAGENQVLHARGPPLHFKAADPKGDASIYCAVGCTCVAQGHCRIGTAAQNRGDCRVDGEVDVAPLPFVAERGGGRARRNALVDDLGLFDLGPKAIKAGGGARPPWVPPVAWMPP